MSNQLTIQQLVKSGPIIESAKRTLGSKGRQFLASVLSLVNENPRLAECDAKSVYNSCLIAATLDLPINRNLGFAYVVPYGNEKKAQFQMGYKGYVQLGIRSGQFLDLDAREVHEGEFLGLDEMTGAPRFKFDITKQSASVCGYMAYFELANGFRKFMYMDNSQVKKHARKYSKNYDRKSSVWSTDFNVMAKKTVLKLLLSKFAPLSTDMARAIEEDQKVDGEYLDKPKTAQRNKGLHVENAQVGEVKEVTE